MSIDRAKALKAAQKYFAKGQLDKAIAEYERVVQDDPQDARTLLKLGDIYTRKGDSKGASATYRKVAEQYAAQGFFLKAVAVYKQILKLDPGQLGDWEKLAEMYEQLSLVSDALSAYEHVADAHTRAGQEAAALHALGRIAELDTANVAACIKYAEALSKANRIDEAATQFELGANVLRAQGRLDDYMKVLERLLYHRKDLRIARDLAGAYLDRNDAKHALTHLQTCFNADPKDLLTLELLGRAFEGLEQPVKALSVYREMARVGAEQGQRDSRLIALRKVVELDPNDRGAQQDLEDLAESSSPHFSIPPVEVDTEDDDVFIVDDEEDEPTIVDDEEDEPTILDDEDEDEPTILDEDDRNDEPVTFEDEAAVAQHPAAAEADELMGECEVFLRYSLDDKAETHLHRILSLVPGHARALEALAQLEAKRAPAAAPAPAPEATSPSPDELTMFDEEDEKEEEDEDEEEDEPELVIEAEDDDYDDDYDDDEEDEEEPELVIEQELEELQPIPAAAAPRIDPTPALSALAPAMTAPLVEDEIPEEIADALEEVEFYAAQGLNAEAIDAVEDALRAHPGHPVLTRRLAELRTGAAIEDKSFEMAQRLAEQAPGGETGSDPIEVNDVIRQFKKGVEQQIDKSDGATHYDLGIAYMEMGLHNEAIDEFRLCLDIDELRCTAHTMIGLSHVSQGQMDSGIQNFHDALQTGLASGDEELGLWFEIGNALELQGKNNDALVYYEKVEEQNPDFRDVAARIERLGIPRSDEEEADEFDEMFDNMILKD